MGNAVIDLHRAEPAQDPVVFEGELPCQHEDPRLWFSPVPAELNLAKAHCRGGPVRRSCLAGAIERAEPHGVWGGEIFRDGVIIALKRPRGRPRLHPAPAPPAPVGP